MSTATSQRRNVTRVRRALACYECYRWVLDRWKPIEADTYWVWRCWLKYSADDARLAGARIMRVRKSVAPTAGTACRE